MKFARLKRVALRALPFVLIFSMLLAVLFFPKERASSEAETRVVRIWNVDTFEGGKGSRTAFLRSVARNTEKKHRGVFILVESYTLEGAEEAFSKGEFPDLISYGIGLSAFAERCIPLPYPSTGGKVGGACFAAAWCRGEYSLFSLDGFDGEGETVISEGGNNLPVLAAAYAGLKGERMEASVAFHAFLSGKFRFLLGTQRDKFRFEARGIAVSSKPLPRYCDLYEYISVLNAERAEDAFFFLDELFSKQTEEKLSSIGMLPPESEAGVRLPSAFSERSALGNLSEMAERGEDIKNIDKFLKTV